MYEHIAGHSKYFKKNNQRLFLFSVYFPEAENICKQLLKDRTYIAGCVDLLLPDVPFLENFAIFKMP